MTYEDMTTVDLKKKVVEVLKEKESVHYTVGWLEFSWLYPQSEEAEVDN